MRWARTGWGTLLVSILLATPLGAAEGVRGDLDVQGAVHLPAGSGLSSAPFALFGNASGGHLHGNASSMRVQVFERRYVGADLVAVRPSVALPADTAPMWESHDAHWETQGAAGGWFGARTAGGRLAETPSTATEVTAVQKGALGNGLAGTDAAEDAWFLATADDTTLLRTSDAWSYHGAMELKVFGPTLLLASRENTTTIQTGESTDPASPGQVVRRWVVLTLEGDVDAAGLPTQVGSPELVAFVDGPIGLDAATGQLRGGLDQWDATGGPTEVAGDLQARLLPMTTGHIDIALSGDLRASTMGSRVASPASSPTLGFALVLLVGVVAGGASAFVIRKRRAQARSSLGPEELMHIADRAADEGDFVRAAELAAEARTLSPTSVRLAIDHAYFVAASGRVTEGLRILASPLVREDPDALMLAARLHLELGDGASAAAALMLALAGTPMLALDLDGDERYAPLLGRPDVKRAMRHARDALR